MESPVVTPRFPRGGHTMRDVCRLSGLSKATVSRVLNNHPNVDSATRSRILEVIAALGYTPSAAARNLSRRKTDLIGLVLPDISTGFYSQVIQGADAAIRARGYNLIVSFAHEENAGFEASLDLLRDRRIDGLVALQPLAAERTSEKLEKTGRPAVLLQKVLPSSALPYVAMDDFGGGECVTRHLVDCGYRRILVVAGPETSRDSCERLRGVRAALPEGGPEIIHTDFTPADAVDKVVRRLERRGAPRPDAIFALNDDMALAVGRVLSERGLCVPGDIGLAGFDGVAAAEFSGLTTFETPLVEMGRTAAGLLIDLIEDRPVSSRSKILPGRLSARKSTVPPA